MIAKRATVRENFFPQKKKCKVVKWRCWKQAINHQQYWVWLLCKIQAWQRVYWDISVGRIITVTSCSRDKLSRCLFWTKIVIQPPLEECIQCGEYYLPAESTLMYSCLKYYKKLPIDFYMLLSLLVLKSGQTCSFFIVFLHSMIDGTRIFSNSLLFFK